jgi:hypothetical protein
MVEVDPADAVQRERREFLRRWKLKWSRLLRMKLTDEHIAQFIGITGNTVNRKINGSVKIKQRLINALVNIDSAIDANRMPELADHKGYYDPDLRRAILSYQIRHPLDYRK